MTTELQLTLPHSDDSLPFCQDLMATGSNAALQKVEDAVAKARGDK